MSCAFLSFANPTAFLANCLEVKALLGIELCSRLLFLEFGGLVFAQYAPALMRALGGLGNGEESAAFFSDLVLVGLELALGFHIVE